MWIETWLIIIHLVLFLGIIAMLFFALKRWKRTLRKERFEWEYLLGTIPDLLIKLDKFGNILYASPSISLFLEIDQVSVVGLNLEDAMIRNQYRGIDPGVFQKVLNGQKAEIIETGRPTIGGEDTFYEIRVIPGPIKSDLLPETICLFRDITRRKQSECELMDAKRKAQESDLLKSAFLANMSHEIRTPLNAILGFSQIILEEDITTEEKSRYSEHIYHNSNQLINLVNDIIDISKLESGQMKIFEHTFNLNQHMEDMKEVLEHEKRQKDKSHILLYLEKEMEDSDSDITSDPYRLRQIILNLLINALKFTPKGFIQFGYRIKEHQSILFYVRDSGIGIDEENLYEIFHYFRQLENNLYRPSSGTGLGLAISRSLVELMGGVIWAESQPGKGSTFYFTIPFKRPA